MSKPAGNLAQEVAAYCARIGADPLLVQGAGGNASWKEAGTLWIKASGTWLADAGEKTAHTRDVSARGICFYLDSSVTEGSEIEFTLTLPPEITLTESIRVRCKGRVLRVEGGTPNGKMAVAAVIDEYEFLADS